MKNYLLLTRPINLLFIILMMILFRYAFILPKFYFIYNFVPALNQFECVLLIITTVLTAASGYIINDIYDSDIDNINKPTKTIIENVIKVDDAYSFYKLICFIAILFTIALTILSKNIKLAMVPVITLVTLNFYAQYFKKKFLIGNLIIATFSSLVLLLPAIYESTIPSQNAIILQIQSGIFCAAICYATFAFLTTFLREIVKDMQDIEGDKMYGCKNIPIQLGFRYTKIINSIIILLIALFVFSFTIFFKKMEMNYTIKYIHIFLLAPLVILLILNWWAKQKQHFGILSNAIKIYMLIGVCTMSYFIYISGSGSHIFIQYFKFITSLIH